MCECFAERKELWHGTGKTLDNRQVAEGTWKIALEAPEFAKRAQSGKFVMLRLPNTNDPLLGRPFAVFDADATSGRVEVLYAVVGKATTKLTFVKQGDPLELWGPLGNGWGAAERERSPKRLALVAGGVGCAPFYALMKEIAAQDVSTRPETTLIYGARTKERLACVEEFERFGLRVELATEDGSAGTRGFVTDVLPQVLADTTDAQILACGPSPMLRAVAKWSFEHNCDCWTSLESPMACGLGICFSCVVDWKTDEGKWDYKRACIDGPVFEAKRLKWD